MYRYRATTCLRSLGGARLIAALLSLPLVATGCVAAQLDVPEVEVTRENVVFEGVPPELAAPAPEGVPSTPTAAQEDYALRSHSFSYDRWEMPQGMTADMVVREVVVTAHQGTPDLSFVRRITLAISLRSDDPNPPLVVLEYPLPERASPATRQSITLPVERPEPLLDPWRTPGAVYELTVWGDVAELPRQPWAVDVTVSLGGKLEFEY
jgi:hypothetical protein